MIKKTKTIPFEIQKGVMKELGLSPKEIRATREFDRRRVEKESEYAMEQETDLWYSNSYGHSTTYSKANNEFNIIYDVKILNKETKLIIKKYKALME